MANTNYISEEQLRDWIRKYKISGEKVLEDSRGNKKKWGIPFYWRNY